MNNNGYMMNNGYMGPGMMNNPVMNQNIMNNNMMNMMANVAVINQMQNKVLNELKNMQQKQQQINMAQINQNNQNNNNFNNNNTNVNNEQNNTDLGNDMISLLFQKTKTGNTIDFKISIICSLNDTIGHVIDKYVSKSLEKKEDLLFLFNAEEIGQYPDETLKSKNILKGSTIIVVNRKGTIAGI